MLDLNKIRSKRKEKGLSQEEMAKRIGNYTRTTYNRIESGEIALKANDLESISNILDEPVSYFFANNSEKISHKAIKS